MIEFTFAFAVAFVTLILGAITKAFINVIPDRYIPIQNVIIGILSGFLSYGLKIETNLTLAVITCIWISLGSGGAYDLITTKGE